jgi:hypothetical protein
LWLPMARRSRDFGLGSDRHGQLVNATASRRSPIATSLVWWPAALAARKGGAPRPRSQGDAICDQCRRRLPLMCCNRPRPWSGRATSLIRVIRGRPRVAIRNTRRGACAVLRTELNATPGTSRDAYATLGPRCGSSTGVPYMNPRAEFSADLGGARRPVACPRRGRLRSTLAARRPAGHTGGHGGFVASRRHRRP